MLRCIACPAAARASSAACWLLETNRALFGRENQAHPSLYDRHCKASVGQKLYVYTYHVYAFYVTWSYTVPTYIYTLLDLY